MSSNHSGEIAISVDNISKIYNIYDKPIDRLKNSLFPSIRKSLGLPERKYFRAFQSLKDVSFEVKKGESVGIIGRNGAGKSTILQIICNTLTATSGSVQVNGRVAALLELGAGFNPEFTGRENIYMSASILGLTDEQVDARYDEIVAFADIGDCLNQPVKTYSSGMYVRLAFSVIAHVDADILIIDEALAVGDVFFTQKCMRFLRAFKERGTLLFVSHDTSSVVSFCERAIWLDNGCIKKIGTAKDVTEKYIEGLYETDDSNELVITQKNPKSENKKEIKDIARMDEIVDQRAVFINNSNLRNDIEIFKFNESSASFGQSGATITSVLFTNEKGKRLSWVVGGEIVVLSVNVDVHQSLVSPIVGFQVKDRLGQVVFGDNTYLSYMDKVISIDKNTSFCAEFEFRMPRMPNGDYSITISIAEGTQEDHVQHEWLHDALMFKVQSSSICHGLMGVAMKDIRIKT
ncbi:MAG: ABC transporter ATP-binding protein [Pseudomonadales bacterium]|nr:ABC transporter ATP-binding protein [Pseudomonadales bacterium]